MVNTSLVLLPRRNEYDFFPPAWNGPIEEEDEGEPTNAECHGAATIIWCSVSLGRPQTWG